MRLVQRRERLKLRKTLHHAIVDADRRSEQSPAMHDAMADCLEPARALLHQPSEQFAQKIFVAELGAPVLKPVVDNRAATGIPRRQMRGDPDFFDLAAEKLPQLSVSFCLPQRELQARRSRVKREDVAGHGHSTGSSRAQYLARAAVL